MKWIVHLQLVGLTFLMLSPLAAQINLKMDADAIRFREGSEQKAFIDWTGTDLRIQNDETNGDLFMNAVGNSYLFANSIAFESEVFGLQVNSGDIDLASGADFNFYNKLNPGSTSYRPVMKINNLGRLGLNTFNPQRLLHLNSQEGSWQVRMEDAGSYFDIYGGSIFQINDNDAIRFILNGSGSNNPGFIGIGNTNPQRLLHLESNSDNGFVEHIRLQRGEYFDINGGTDLEFKDENGTKFFIDGEGTNEGNIGIGTSIPNRKLHVITSPSAPQVRLQDNRGYFDLYGGADFLLQDEGGTRLFVKGSSANAGNVGIGNTDPQRKLHLQTTAAPQLRLQDDGGFMDLYGGADFVLRNAAGTNRLVVQGAGSIFAYNLSNIGDFRNMQYNDLTGEIGYDNSSRKDKRNIQDLKDNFAALLEIAPKTYTRPWAPERWEIGFIAEDFHEKGLYPLVEYDQTGRPDGLRYDKMITYIVPLLKQQQETLEGQEALIDQLEREVELMKKELAAIREMIRNGIINPSGQSSQPQENAPADTGALLEQNTPNPFSENTLIRYFIPENTRQAALNIIDAGGKVLKRFTLSRQGKGQLELPAYSLPGGTYFYQLLLDGRTVSTRTMVLKRQ